MGQSGLAPNNRIKIGYNENRIGIGSRCFCQTEGSTCMILCTILYIFTKLCILLHITEIVHKRSPSLLGCFCFGGIHNILCCQECGCTMTARIPVVVHQQPVIVKNSPLEGHKQIPNSNTCPIPHCPRAGTSCNETKGPGQHAV